MPMKEDGKESGQPCWCKKMGNKIVNQVGCKKTGKQSGQLCRCINTERKVVKYVCARKGKQKWSTMPV